MRRNVHDLLCSRGFYILKKRNVSIASALPQVVQEEIPWASEDFEKPVEKCTLSIKQDNHQAGYVSVDKKDH